MFFPIKKFRTFRALTSLKTVDLKILQAQGCHLHAMPGQVETGEQPIFLTPEITLKGNILSGSSRLRRIKVWLSGFFQFQSEPGHPTQFLYGQNQTLKENFRL